MATIPFFICISVLLVYPFVAFRARFAQDDVVQNFPLSTDITDTKPYIELNPRLCMP